MYGVNPQLGMYYLVVPVINEGPEPVRNLKARADFIDANGVIVWTETLSVTHLPTRLGLNPPSLPNDPAVPPGELGLKTKRIRRLLLRRQRRPVHLRGSGHRDRGDRQELEADLPGEHDMIRRPIAFRAAALAAVLLAMLVACSSKNDKKRRRDQGAEAPHRRPLHDERRRR